MKLENKTIIFTLFLSLGFTCLYSQPIIKQLEENSEIINFNASQTGRMHLKKTVLDSLQLPFFDDFSSVTVFPNPDLWSDKYAFINNTFPVNPVTFGVATLDLLDQNGSLYTTLSVKPSQADYLTSHPFKLNYLPSDKIYLSFMYQPQGYGDAPETGDSLILDFYSPADSLWHTTWSIGGSLLAPFKHVVVPVLQEKYLQKGFRFRFRNLGSISKLNGSDGRKSNADHWHIDYVYLNKDRSPSDTIFNDVAFTKVPTDFIKDYSSMPWDHFKAVFGTKIESDIYINLHNLSPAPSNITRMYKIKETISNLPSNIINGGAENIGAYERLRLADYFDFPFEKITKDSAKFIIQSYLITNSFDFSKQNDTVTTTVDMTNYYSYDDGSSELGFGMDGSGTQHAMLAYKFNAVKGDTLRAVNFHFNSTADNVSEKYFFLLTVWNDKKGKPGDIIYSKTGYKPLVNDQLNQFHTYYLDSVVYIMGDFYVGWIQTRAEFMNVGFDMNNTVEDKIFYNINGTWAPYNNGGSLMIRPVFGKDIRTDIVYKKSNFQSITIYPNPATEYINFNLPQNANLLKTTVRIFNNAGSMIYESVYNAQPINVSNFKNGLYILVINNDLGSFQNKFIINK